MKTFSKPHNPEGLPAASPGYRYIGREDPYMPRVDEIHTVTNGWKIAWKDATRNPYWTYRRALNVDDPYAPPPDQWSKPGYVMSGPDDLRTDGEEVWMGSPIPAAPEWVPVRNGIGEPWHVHRNDPYYYRRPIAKTLSMNTTQSVPHDWISLKTRIPTREEGLAGVWFWNQYPGSKGYADLVRYDPEGYKAHERTSYTHWKSAAQDIPAPPVPVLPPAPKVNGYDMVYDKGSEIVVFGCARIDVRLFREADTFLHVPFSDKKGNRTVRGIMLSSGVEVTTAQIAEILAYVDAVNKG